MSVAIDINNNNRCIYCLEDNLILPNRLCNCKYFYHIPCQKQFIINSTIQCPLCRTYFHIVDEQTMPTYHLIQFIHTENIVYPSRIFSCIKTTCKYLCVYLGFFCLFIFFIFILSSIFGLLWMK